MPTLKQKIAFREITEKHKNVGKAMRDAGYTKVTSKRPYNLTQSKGWKELMEQHMPDSILAKKHRELLNKKETVRRFDEETKKTVIEKTDEIDVQAVTKGLDMAYKLKNRYADEEDKKETNRTQVNILIMTTKELLNEKPIETKANEGTHQESVQELLR